MKEKPSLYVKWDTADVWISKCMALNINYPFDTTWVIQNICQVVALPWAENQSQTIYIYSNLFNLLTL